MSLNAISDNIPCLTELSGQVLTAENWQSIGIDIASIELEALLVKPGLAVLERLESLHAYFNWHGTLILLIPPQLGATLKIKSAFDGQHLSFFKAQIEALIQKFQSPRVVIQEKQAKNYNNKPAEDALSGILYQHKAEPILITDNQYTLDVEILDKHCTCPACKAGYTRAYFHHLFTHTPLLCHRWLVMHNYSVSSAN